MSKRVAIWRGRIWPLVSGVTIDIPDSGKFHYEKQYTVVDDWAALLDEDGSMWLRVERSSIAGSKWGRYQRVDEVTPLRMH